MLIAKFAIFSHQLFAEQSPFLVEMNPVTEVPLCEESVGWYPPQSQSIPPQSQRYTSFKKVLFQIEQENLSLSVSQRSFLSANTTTSFHLNFPNFLLHRCPNYSGTRPLYEVMINHFLAVFVASRSAAGYYVKLNADVFCAV